MFSRRKYKKTQNPSVFRKRSGAFIRTRSAKFAQAASLIEAAVAMAVLTLAMLGAMSYEFHAKKDTQIAYAQTSATRIAQLLLEDWKSTGGSDEYNPTFLDLGFSSALSIPAGFSYDKSLGYPLNDAVYSIKINDIPMMVMLAWKEIAYDKTAEIQLRQLAAIVQCREASGESDFRWLENIESVTLVTYARVDASDG